MKLLLSGLLVSAVVLVPTVARADCLGAIATVQTAIGQSQLRAVSRVEDMSSYRPDHPKGRPYQMVLELSGGDTGSFMRAAGVRRKMAQYLIDECPTLSAVDFADDGAPRATIGLLPGGKVDFFKCVRTGGGGASLPGWGKAYCNPNMP